MDIDPHAARLLRILGAGAPTAPRRVTIDERRRSFEGLMRLSGSPPAVASVEETTMPGPAGPLRARLYRPFDRTGDATPALVYFHGGGLVAGRLDDYDVLMRLLAHEARCLVIAVDYRLAPEHPCPAAIDDAVAAVRHVFDRAPLLGVDRDRIAIGGDSGGGTLVAIATQVLRGEPEYRAKCQMLLCPVLDFVEESPSRTAFAEGFLLDRALMARDLEDYAPGRPLDDPWISPLRATDLSGLPPAMIHTAGFDPMRDEGRAYADALALHGTPVRYTCHETMVHHFYGLSGMIPAARTILARIGAELSDLLEGRRLRS